MQAPSMPSVRVRCGAAGCRVRPGRGRTNRTQDTRVYSHDGPITSHKRYAHRQANGGRVDPDATLTCSGATPSGPPSAANTKRQKRTDVRMSGGGVRNLLVCGAPTIDIRNRERGMHPLRVSRREEPPSVADRAALQLPPPLHLNLNLFHVTSAAPHLRNRGNDPRPTHIINLN
eukprot:787405-Prorocentrum_minimum.AAC.1